MLKERMKHVVLIILAVTLIGVGYLNYDYGNTLEVALVDNDSTDEANLGDVELVNGEAVKEDIVPNDNIDDKTTITSNDINKNEYFSKTRLDRENMYSQMIETYQKIINSNEITNEQKAIAISEIDNITKTKNAIMISENLIKNKNFDDVVILVSNGNASVIIQSDGLNKDQISQVQNIVTRELGIEPANINISQK